MRKKIAIALTAGVAAATVGFGATGTASAAPSRGGQCVQDGIQFLKDNDLFQKATKKQNDYSAFADPVNGPIRLDLPAGSNLSLGQVVSLHATSPDTFAWCDLDS